MGRGRPLTIEAAKRVVGLAVADPLMAPYAMAPLVGRDDQTCRKLLSRYQGLIQEYRRIKTPQVVEEVDIIRRAYLAQLADPTVVTQCSGPQAAVVYGILTDKVLIESGRPTSISLGVTVDATMPDVLGRLRRVLELRAHTTSSGEQVKQPVPVQIGQHGDGQVIDSTDDAAHDSYKE